MKAEGDGGGSRKKRGLQGANGSKVPAKMISMDASLAKNFIRTAIELN